ncbi:coiled-coil-helix-coiled-coil-helix domain-containing protein 7-like [Daphnia pulex]|uniref:coiled-coil-helix-coiled-coil-helix domain-containing protein 7-like n=1 Tax=Daphnia pulex TaxID=6669 RepID=UPI001EDEA6B3|nr:coiled-coil-helix-coiled-coil-helix domain-containing protein 7-like [Daphnia pulex]
MRSNIIFLQLFFGKQLFSAHIMEANQLSEAERSNQRRIKNRQSTEFNNEINNPCSKEHKMANECSVKHFEDRDKCKAYFANYRSCMEFWTNIKAERRRERIRPLLPPPEEREQILRDARSKAKLS